MLRKYFQKKKGFVVDDRRIFLFFTVSRLFCDSHGVKKGVC